MSASGRGVKYKLFIALFLLLAVVTPAIHSISLKRSERAAFLAEEAGLRVLVSVLPQKFFVERIGGERVDVSVLVGPGHSPSTYEPLPKQMLTTAESLIYFRIGVPFEDVWLGQIKGLNPGLEVIDTRKGIELRKIEGSQSGFNGMEREVRDPHIWLDPLLVKVQAKTIYEGLTSADPEHEDRYRQGLEAFQKELDGLNLELEAAFSSLPVKKLMVFHPAWGYLLDRYGLEQVPIELEGKEPGPRALAELIHLAENEKIEVIFVEEQRDARAAASVAEAVGAKIVKLDPLAEDYLTNLRRIAQIIREEHQ